MFLRRRDRKKREAPAEEQGGVARGCLAIATDVLVWVFSTIFITLGIFLFLYGVLDFSPESRLRTAVIVILVPLAVFFLIRIGRQILDDLKDGDGPG